MEMKFEILPFQLEHQIDIDEMMKNISMEFRDSIFTEKSKKIVEIFSLES